MSIVTGGEPAASALSSRLRKSWSRRNGSPAQQRSTPSSDSLRSACLSLRASLRWADDSHQTVRRSQGILLELDGGRVAAHILIEMVEVILCVLEPADQVECFRAITDSQGEHLETRLAALQGVAAFMGQPGDHLTDGGQTFRLKRRSCVCLTNVMSWPTLRIAGSSSYSGRKPRSSRRSSGASRHGR